MMDMRIGAERRQTTTLSPRLQQAVRLLQMSSTEFAALLRDKAGANPFLELELDDGAEGEAPGAAADADANAVTDEHDRDLWHAAASSSAPRGDGEALSALELMAAERSLAAHLHEQLSLLPLPPRDSALAHAIAESLDDDGYLRTPLEELLGALVLDPPATLAELTIALRRVQSLEPAGVGARSVAECLRLQLPQIEDERLRALAAAIVDEHLAALAARDIAGLARALGETAQRIDAACERIRHLDPRPGWRIGASAAAYIVPDVIVRKSGAVWQAQLNPAVLPRMRLNRTVAELFQRHRRAQDAALAEHLQDARWTLRNVEQRFSTILDVAQAIVRRQRHFLDFGPMAMKPLGLKEIADEVGVHESTVSRVTHGKYMATPQGVFELKHFFSRAMLSANGRACSGTAIRGLVKDIIEAESPAQPLSDVAITRALERQGLTVARRTVTKYRQMLKIEAVERRRRCAAG